MNSLSKKADLEQVRNSDISAYWYYGNSLEEPKIAADLLLPFECHLLHNVFDVREGGPRRVEVGFLQVTERLRGGKIGEKLVRGLGALTQKYAFPELSVGVASQFTLDILDDVFGRDRMTLYGAKDTSVYLARAICGVDATEVLNIGFEKARAQLVELEQRERNLEDRQWGFPVTINLDGLEMSNWGLPTEYNRGGIDLSPLSPVKADELAL